MSGIGTRLGAYRALGLNNVARVGAYRLGLKLGIHPVQRLRAKPAVGPFFAPRPSPPPKGATARTGWQGEGEWFSAHAVDCGGPPDWHRQPFTGGRADDRTPWHRIADFNPELGDIKAVWEPSRFDWLLAMAQRAALGDRAELDRLNLWLDDWARANPPYSGINWKCGQEASIRVMHLALAAIILDQVEQPLNGLIDLVRLHLQRIAPTISYAIGQANNHGTSEAAALFIGGTWLERLGQRVGAEWARIGRRWLEERARTLIAADGTFSQYSLVYHRVMLDSYALAVSWRRLLGLAPFSTRAHEQLGAATLWLQQMIDPASGDAPNFGANDGAQLMRLSDGQYRDFRPTLQWTSALFLDRLAIEAEGHWDAPLRWLLIDRPKDLLPLPESHTLDEGGLHVLRAGDAIAYLRFPRFRFRPSQGDALHLDLWVAGRNLLRDDGTYSYADTADHGATFGSVASHNSVQFDNRDQMPRLGRFLYARWLKSHGVVSVATGQDGTLSASAAYRDDRGAEHRRSVELSPNQLACHDQLSGNAKKAVLRWRLPLGDWKLDDNRVIGEGVVLTIDSDQPVAIRLAPGWESRSYMTQSELVVVEAEVTVPAKLSTRIEF